MFLTFVKKIRDTRQIGKPYLCFMKYSLPHSLEILERTPDLLKAWLSGLSEEWTHTNEGGETWSAYDILGHFIHGEKTDWIPRMEIILSDRADKTFVPFDRFAQFRDSEGKTLEELFAEFKRLRMESLERLRAAGLTEADWDKEGVHPEFGTVTLSELLATWVVHDMGHIAQIARVMAHQYRGEIGPWKAYLGIMKGK